jgi:16S rRNA processing protein RimM
MEFIQIGKLKKTYGLQGDLKCFIEDRFWEDLLEADVLFVEIKGQQIPFFIEEIKEGVDVLLKFEEVDKPEAAAALSGKNLYMRLSDLSSTAEGGLSFEDRLPSLVGFMIMSEQGQEIGPIKELIDMPMQVLALVDKNGEEVMIPLVEDLVKDVLEAEQTIIMSLPDGLLNL